MTMLNTNKDLRVTRSTIDAGLAAVVGEGEDEPVEEVDALFDAFDAEEVIETVDDVVVEEAGVVRFKPAIPLA